MSIVGIIANPASGKDIRRLVAHASVFDNNEKVNIVRRVLLGLDAVGVDAARVMPDYFGIGERAAHGLKLSFPVETISISAEWTLNDSTQAAARMAAEGVDVIITLGGDGTNRAVAKGCERVPLVPISTGTNNVFPTLVEGTVAGLAAGLIARGSVDAASCIQPTKRLEIVREGETIDIALVDAVVYEGQYVGARAIWQEEGIRQIVLTRAEPYAIGLSAIGGLLLADNLDADEGLAIEVGQSEQYVLAPIAPGLIRRIGITSHQRLRVGESIAVQQFPNVLALDGERTIVMPKRESVQIRLSDQGPRVVDIRATMREAAANGFFMRAAENSRMDTSA